MRVVIDLINSLTIVSIGRWLDRDIAIDVVPSWYVRSQAENVARHTAGVIEMDNSLQVMTRVSAAV